MEQNIPQQPTQQTQPPQTTQQIATPPLVQQPKNNVLLPVLISVLITAILIGGGVFFWQQSQIANFKNQNEKINADNTALKTQIEKLQKIASEAAAQKEDIAKKTCKGVWKNGVCVKPTCVDSDVNEKPNDIYIKGTVTYTDANGVETVTNDTCTGSKTQVNEMWCYESPAGSGNLVQGTMTYNCPKGCLDGACIK